MYFGDVKAGQTFYYSVNFTPNPGGGFSIPGLWSGTSFSDWSGLAQRVAAAAGSASAMASVIGSGEGNITLSVTSTMDRASMDDLRGNLDGIVASQPEVAGVTGSVIRLVSSPSSPGPSGGSVVPSGGGGGGGSIPSLIPPALSNTVAPIASTFGLSPQQLLLIGGGLLLFMFLKK